MKLDLVCPYCKSEFGSATLVGARRFFYHRIACEAKANGWDASVPLSLGQQEAARIPSEQTEMAVITAPVIAKGRCTTCNGANWVHANGFVVRCFTCETRLAAAVVKFLHREQCGCELEVKGE